LPGFGVKVGNCDFGLGLGFGYDFLLAYIRNDPGR
jgi:hypothetical protein